MWKKSLIRWNQNTDVPMWRRFEKLSKQLDWDLQGKFEHVPESTLAGPGYLDAVVSILDGLAGEKDASEKRRVVRAALFEGQRKKDETLSQFAVRREQEFAGADRYLAIPSELKAFILEETAGLTRQGVQNLRTLTSGAGDFDKMVGALKTLDVEEEPLTKAKGGMFSGIAGEAGDQSAAGPEAEDGYEDDEDYDEQVETFLAQVDDVDEEVALEMLSAFERDQARAPERRRTWKQNKDRKAAARKDRRVFSRPRLSVADLKERTRCANCGERGHWKAECKKPYRSKEERGKTDAHSQDLGRRAVSFVYLGYQDEAAPANTFVGWSSIPDLGNLEADSGWRNGPVTAQDLLGYPILRKSFGKVAGHPLDYLLPREALEEATHGDNTGKCVSLAVAAEAGTLCFFNLDPGHAILDIGAAQDLIGKEAFDKLSHRLRAQGLRALRLEAQPPSAHGVGGKATPMFQALIPCILAGIPGVVRVTVIKENIPHLISVGLLEATGAAIDMRRNTVSYQELGVSEPMLRLKSGHRAVDIAVWRGGSFPTPPHLKEEFGLTEGAFNTGVKLSGAAVEVYMLDGGGDQDVLLCRGRPAQLPSEFVKCGLQGEACAAAAEALGDRSSRAERVNENMAVVTQRLARSGSEPPRADRFVSHGEQRRAQVERTCDTSAASPGASREAGGESAMHSPRRLRGQWGKSIWLLAAMSALSNQDQLRAPPQPPEGEGWEIGRVCQRASASTTEIREGVGQPGEREQDDRGGGGDWQGHGREQPPAAGGHGSVQPAGVARDGAKQSAGDGDDGHHGADDAGDAGHPAHHGPGSATGGKCSSSRDGSWAELARREHDASYLSGRCGTCRGGGIESPMERRAAGSSGGGMAHQPRPRHVSSETGTIQDEIANEIKGKMGHEDLGTIQNEIADEIKGRMGHEDIGTIPSEIANEIKGKMGPQRSTIRIPHRRRNRLLVGPNENYYTLAAHEAGARVPSCLCGDGARLCRGHQADGNGSEVLVEWPAPGLREHLVNLDLEGEPDYTIAGKEQKKLRRAMRELTKLYPKRAPRRKAIIFHVRGGDTQPLARNLGNDHRCAEVIDFVAGDRWDLSSAPRQRVFEQLVQKFDPDLLVVEATRVGEGTELKDQVRHRVAECFCHRLCRESMEKGRAVAWEMGNISQADQEDLEKLGGVVLHRDGRSGSFATNHAGTMLGYDRQRTTAWAREAVGCFLEIEQARLNLAIEDDEQPGDAEIEVDDLEAERDGPWQEGAGVGSFPPEGPDEGHSGTARREREVKALVEKLHLNLGHLSKERMVVMLKAAGARDDVLDFVQKRFECEMCDRRQREVRRRVAAYPRTYTFNRIVAVDTVYVPWRGVSLPVLNVVDHGSHYQVMMLIKELDGTPHRGGTPTSEEAWRTFNEAWVRPFGAPEVVLSDAGAEFMKEFANGLELNSVLHHVVDADSPWQNGIAERHGGEIKRRLLRELSEGQTVLSSREDVDLMLCHLTTCKNQWYTRAGYSPAQLVFGRNPRIPEELLSDQVASAPGRQAMASDPTNLEGSERAYVQSCIIRQRARELMFEKESKEKLQRAARAPRHPYQQFAAGQWVYVFRRAPQRARWSGPGLVLLHQGTTVWVAMRARLWKCNVDQVRPANSTEALGVEVVNSLQYQDLLKNMEGKRAGAVDVSREGAPPEDAWEEPREEEGPILSPGPARAEEEVSSPGPPAVASSVAEEERRPRRVSIQSTTVPSEGSQASDEPEAKRHCGEDGLETIEEENEEEQERGRSTAAAARSVDVSPVPRLAAREEQPARRRSRSPVPPVQRAALQHAQAEQLEQMRQQAQEEQPVDQEELLSETFPLQNLLENRRSERELEESCGPEPVLFCLEEREAEGAPVLVACRSDEFNMKKATPEELKGFRESDATEWNNVLGMGAVRVWKGSEAQQLRQEHAGRILRSRMVRRKKPMPGVGCFKYKSRWCVLGFDDPDGPELKTFSPTPQAEIINVFFQAALNLGLNVVFGDVTSAFCQGKKLRRAAGRLFAEPCSGIDAEPGDLVELLVAVYGLEDAPVCWAETVQEYLCQDLGFRKSLLDPCLYVRQNLNKPVAERVEAMILVEVDDFNVAVRPEFEHELLQDLRNKFLFGKWLRNEADFNGRRVKITENDVYMHQEKYVLEKLKPLELSRSRRAQKDSELLPQEAEEFRSMLYKVSWLSHQTRPEAAGLTSILSSRLNRATISDVITLNKMVGHLRSTPRQGIRLRRFRPEEMCFIGISDAGGVDGQTDGDGPDGMLEDPVQGSWLVLASDRVPTHDEHLRVSVLSWRSTKLKRRVTSTLASETLAFSQCLGEIEWMQVLYRDITHGDVTAESWRNVIKPFACLLRNGSAMAGRQQQCSITDAKSLYDALVKSHPASRQDRRNSLELAAIIDAMGKGGGVVRWTSHQRMVADMLTKADLSKGNGALLHLLRTGVLHIDDEASELRRRETSDGRARSKAATHKLLSQEEAEEQLGMNLYALTMARKVSINLGKLLSNPCTFPLGSD